MTPEERLERLEHRVATLETLLRRLTAGGAAAPAPPEKQVTDIEKMRWAVLETSGRISIIPSE